MRRVAEGGLGFEGDDSLALGGVGFEGERCCWLSVGGVVGWGIMGVVDDECMYLLGGRGNQW